LEESDIEWIPDPNLYVKLELKQFYFFLIPGTWKFFIIVKNCPTLVNTRIGQVIGFVNTCCFLVLKIPELEYHQVPSIWKSESKKPLETLNPPNPSKNHQVL